MPKSIPEKYTLLEDLDDDDEPHISDDECSTDEEDFYDKNMTPIPKNKCKKRNYKRYLIEAVCLALAVFLVLRYTHMIDLPVLSKTPVHVNQTLIILAIFFAFRYFT